MVVKMLNDPDRNLSGVGPWIWEVKEIISSFEEAKVTWARRSANKAAHKLARVRVGDEISNVWRLMPPDSILDVIADEIPNLN